MYQTVNKVLVAASELDLQTHEFRQLGAKQWQSVLRQVFERFANTHKTNISWLWSCLKESGTAVQSEDGITAIMPLFVPETKVWLLVEDSDGNKKLGNYWVFEGNYGAVTAVLKNMHFLEYYIVDSKFTWMLLENHHGFVVAVGEPAESMVRGFQSAQQACAADARTSSRG